MSITTDPNQHEIDPFSSSIGGNDDRDDVDAYEDGGDTNYDDGVADEEIDADGDNEGEGNADGEFSIDRTDR